jgi:putative transcriptional regulator
MKSPQTGSLLIADPLLNDPTFYRSVIILCEKDEKGTFGLQLNKQLNYKLGELIENFEGQSHKVFIGGPVQLDTLHFLHKVPDLIDGGKKIAPNVYWGGNFETVIQLIKNQQLNDADIRFYLGYSGWSAGQIEDEMKSNQPWILGKALESIIFNSNSENIWSDALASLGGKYELYKNFPSDPQLN